MTTAEMRRVLAAKGRLFTLPLHVVKQRIGEPCHVSIAPRWCSRTGRDLVTLGYQTDEGLCEIHGLMGFLNNEPALFDAWVTIGGEGPELPGAPGKQMTLGNWAVE